VEANFGGHPIGLKMAADGIRNLFLKLSQVLALSGDAALTVWSVPRRDEEPRLFTPFDLEDYILHVS
jgi:hypothetical protein